MIEVTFSDSAAAALKTARFEVGEEEKLVHSVYSLPLCMDIGPIQGDVLGDERRKVLDELHRPFEFGDEVTDQVLETAATALREIPILLKNGECLRIWYSDAPFEMCGAMWFMSWLSHLPARGEVRLVHLPPWIERKDGTVVMHTSCAELEPEDFVDLAHREVKVPLLLLSGRNFEWEQLVAQNTLLRSVIAGQVVSVPEDFYDFLVYMQLCDMPDVFSEALLIGNVLGYTQLGLNDGWLALRIDKMIQKGELEVVEDRQDEHAPSYHRTLRKCNAQ